MKSLRHAVRIALLSLILALATPIGTLLPGQDTTVEAAAKLNKKSILLLKGQSTNLKLTGIKGKVTWKSSKKSVASVTSNGKVTARQKGTARITAKVGKKSFNCKVTVQAPVINKKSLTLKKGASTTLKLSGTNQKIT